MKIVSRILQAVGALALLFVVAAAIWLCFFSQFSGANKRSGKDDAVFVLNWAGVDPAQQWHVIESSVSARSLTGDHADYYCIQLENISKNDPNNEDWSQGPEANPLMSQALEDAIQWAQLEDAKCIPSVERANSPDMQIMFWSMTTHGRRPARAEVLLLEPSTKRLFYISYAT